MKKLSWTILVILLLSIGAGAAYARGNAVGVAFSPNPSDWHATIIGQNSADRVWVRVYGRVLAGFPEEPSTSFTGLTPVAEWVGDAQGNPVNAFPADFADTQLYLVTEGWAESEGAARAARVDAVSYRLDGKQVVQEFENLAPVLSVDAMRRGAPAQTGEGGCETGTAPTFAVFLFAALSIFKRRGARK
jgi:hypothetical protein